jgi:hypothetical protein
MISEGCKEARDAGGEGGLGCRVSGLGFRV